MLQLTYKCNINILADEKAAVRRKGEGGEYGEEEKGRGNHKEKDREERYSF